MISLEKIDEFVKKYSLFRETLANIRLEQFKRDFSFISEGIKHTKRIYEELERYRASSFNIFSLLGVTNYEVTTHSALLGELLSPKGTHGQDDLFLRKFLAANKIFEIPVIDTGIWNVETEKTTWFGRLDIVISAINIKRCIVIENKIDAEDQPQQLQRYYNWLESTGFPLKENCKLIYLTKKGSEPSDDSCGFDSEVKNFVTLMSYEKDIYNWLSECLLEIKALSVKSIIEQYIEIIKHF